jgi:hypothetical protein
MSGDFAWWRDRDWILLLIRQLQQGLAIIINNGGVPKTAVIIGSGSAPYAVKPTDSVISFDSSVGAQTQPVATLNAGTYIGEPHSFVWYGWGGNQTPPLIQGAVGVLMMPYAGMQTEGIGGLSNSTVINQTGGFITYEWTGAFWAQVG